MKNQIDTLDATPSKRLFLSETWKKIEFYYRLRCKLIHERVTVGVDDPQIEDFREVVEYVPNKLFKLKFTI